MFNMPLGQTQPDPDKKETETPAVTPNAAPIFPYPVAPESTPDKPGVNPADPEIEHGRNVPAQPVQPSRIRRIFAPARPMPDEGEVEDPDHETITPRRGFGV